MITALSRVRSRLRVRWLGGVTVPTRPLNRDPIPQTGELATVNRQLQDAWERLRGQSEASAEDSGSLSYFLLFLLLPAALFIVCKCLKK